MLEDAEVKVVLTQERLINRLWRETSIVSLVLWIENGMLTHGKARGELQEQGEAAENPGGDLHVGPPDGSDRKG